MVYVHESVIGSMVRPKRAVNAVYTAGFCQGNQCTKIISFWYFHLASWGSVH
jgi:hypothetical protein